MSRIGRKPVEIPSGVKVSISDYFLEVQGPKGKMATHVPRGMQVRQEGNSLVVRPRTLPKLDVNKADIDRLTQQEKASWGLARSLTANALYGVTQGYQRELEIVGVGYRAEVQGQKVVFSLGYSRPVEFPLPEGIEVTVERNTRVIVRGINKALVGQVAKDIRALRPPDPYKQKGIRFAGEPLRKKAGKAAVGAK